MNTDDLMNPNKLAMKLAACAKQAMGGFKRGQSLAVLQNWLRSFNFTAEAMKAGWRPMDAPRFMRDEKGGGYAIFDVTRSHWITIPAKSEYSKSDMEEWAHAFSRMEGFAMDRPKVKVGRPRGKKHYNYVRFIEKARSIEAEGRIGLMDAMRELAPKFGVKESEFRAELTAFGRNKS